MPEPDARLIEAHDLALAALYEITPHATVGPAAGYQREDSGAVSLRFENRLPGYPGWFWTVTVAAVGDAEPTVLEAELMPGGGALLAPDWVPWAERLADYRAHQIVLAEQAAQDAHDLEAARELEDDPDADAEGADEFDDLDDDESDLLHAGDLDGVDIDVLDDSAADFDEEFEDDDTDVDDIDADESE